MKTVKHDTLNLDWEEWSHRDFLNQNKEQATALAAGATRRSKNRAYHDYLAWCYERILEKNGIDPCEALEKFLTKSQIDDLENLR